MKRGKVDPKTLLAVGGTIRRSPGRFHEWLDEKHDHLFYLSTALLFPVFLDLLLGGPIARFFVRWALAHMGGGR